MYHVCIMLQDLSCLAHGSSRPREKEGEEEKVLPACECLRDLECVLGDQEGVGSRRKQGSLPEQPFPLHH